VTDADALKRAAAERAVELVRPGMVVGLGTGSTAVHATRRIGELLREGVLADVVGVPTSEATARVAREVGIPLVEESLPVPVDLTIDGADEVDPALDLIKGAGGAFLREKVVAQASARLAIVVDDSKLVERLGSERPLPVEVTEFGWRSQLRFLEALGAAVEPREGFRTDTGNLVLDAAFGPIEDARRLAASLDARAGVVAHGLFLGLASDVFTAGPEGVRHLIR
jgi:ribose 5-phosphate isomerase A